MLQIDSPWLAGLLGGAISTVMGLVVAHLLGRSERRDANTRNEFDALLKGYKERIEQLQEREQELEQDCDQLEKRMQSLQGEKAELQKEYQRLEERHMNLWRRYQSLKENGQ